MAKASEVFPALHSGIPRAQLSIWLRRFHAWRQKRRDRLELDALGKSALKDLAIDRSEITSIIHAGSNERRRNHGD
ncbi:DUF1127 domain-containing protein [Roseibium sp. MMSF_3544]|uniref:DUF1127 domain-containing protein n=1 Tax=unclassified Roseibium TaxID=2629323 RepID=UPI00273FDB0E|nr:DUF1127 domain-containing protein [Roseibium sp. MMSF_3544]